MIILFALEYNISVAILYCHIAVMWMCILLPAEIDVLLNLIYRLMHLYIQQSNIPYRTERHALTPNVTLPHHHI